MLSILDLFTIGNGSSFSHTVRPMKAACCFVELRSLPESSLTDLLAILDSVNLDALAVNEENAASRRVVMASTNSAAGNIRAILPCATRFGTSPDADSEDHFLLKIVAIGLLDKRNASISGADVGDMVSFEKMIKTIWETRRDLMSEHKEKSRGGLVVNVSEPSPQPTTPFWPRSLFRRPANRRSR